MRRIILTILALLAPATLSAQDSVNADALMRDMRVLAADDIRGRGTGTDGAARAREYIERRFSELGLEVYRAPFRYAAPTGGNQVGANVWVMVRGSERPDKIIVVGAHYDHVGVRGGEIHNGADDNASGTAALLAIAASLQRTAPRHSVLLVAFDAEELGLFGSRVFVQGPPVPLENILLNINLDMVGRGDRGVLWAAGPRIYPALRPAVEAAAAAASISVRLGRDYRPPRPGRGRDDLTLRSDQAAFGIAGIPWVFFTAGDHSDYHKPTDDAELVDPRFYGSAVAAVLDALRRLDADPAALDTARQEGDSPRWR
jgi:Zn-dependent M28 family amino/carboxypeptidase